MEKNRAAKGRIQYIAIAWITYYFLLSTTSSCTFFGAVITAILGRNLAGEVAEPVSTCCFRSNIYLYIYIACE